MQHLVYPTGLESFYDNWWKKVPLLSARGNKTHFKVLPTRKSIEKSVQEHAMALNKDIQIRKSGDSIEDSDSDSDIISAKRIWKYFDDGYVLELLHPQKYFDKLWQYISLLEIEIKSTIVPSLIVAPSGAQCFENDLLAERADTIVLQLAGSCSWALTSPEGGSEGKVGEKRARTRAAEVTHCGDALYIPPEWTFSCAATIGEEAVFCIMRTNHNRSVLDVTEMVATQSVAKMVNVNRNSNEPLPRDFFTFMGVAHSEEDEDPRRTLLAACAKRMMSRLINDAVDMLDAAADQMAKDFVSSRAPIPLSEEEDRLSFSGSGRDIKLFPYSKIRMIRPGVAIAVVEDGHIAVYHCMENSRDPDETVLSPVEFELDDGPAIEEILNSYPHGVTVSDLPHSSEELDDKVEIARSLFREGFLM
ncbi:unnamed protein product, partial [Ectocarpus fasciculatus]